MTLYLAQIGSPAGLRKLLEASWAQEAQEFEGGDRRRKLDFRNRRLIDAERYKNLVYHRINQVYESDEAVELLRRFVTMRRNLLRKFADRVAIAYDRPPVRTLRRVSESKRRAFFEAYDAAQIQTLAPMWGRNAWLCNVVHVLPRWETEGLTWVTVLPHAADVLFDPDGEDQPSILIYSTASMGAAWIAVDRERWWWIDKDWRLVDEEEHGLGRRPWATFRVAPENPDDYWDRGRRQTLADSTIDLARIEAHKEWARKAKSTDAPYLFVDEEAKLPPKQVLNGEDVLFGRATNVTIGALPLIVAVDEFVKQMADIEKDQAEAEGVPPSIIDWRASNVDRAVEHAALVKVRDKMLPHLRRSELELASITGELLDQVGHPGGLPAGTVRKEFRVGFAPMTFADHPAQRVKTAQTEMELAATTPAKFYQSEHPHLTEEEALEEVQANQAAIADFHEVQASRNTPARIADSLRTSIQSLPQVQGAIGGQMAADDNRPPQDA